LEYVNLDLTPASENLIEKYNSLKTYLYEKEKEDRIKFLYRGDKISNIENRLNSDDTILEDNELFRRVFYFGEKSRHFTLSQLSNDGEDFFENINDLSDNTLGYIYDKIFNFLDNDENDYIIEDKISENFKNFFNGHKKETFIQLINRGYNKKTKLLMRDYFLYFLHITGVSIKNHSMFVSASTDYQVASNFSNNEENIPRVIIHYFISSPYYRYAIAPWMINQHKDIVIGCNLPTYNAEGLYPNEKEVSIKGAMLGHFMLGMELINENKFIINHHIQEIETNDLEEISNNGLNFNQDTFESDIFSTAFLRWAEVDTDGNIEEFRI
jgi:hypothetical protein